MNNTKKESPILKTAKIDSLNVSILSALVDNTFKSMDYNGDYYIRPVSHSIFQIAVPTCECDFANDDFFEPMFYRLFVRVDQVASHMELFVCALKALISKDLSCEELLMATDAYQDNTLFEAERSRFPDSLQEAIQKDAVLCVRWMVNNLKKDKVTMYSLLPLVVDNIREGHSFAELGLTPENISQLGLDCIEPAIKGDHKALYTLGLLYHSCDHDSKAEEVFNALISNEEPLGYSGMSFIHFKENVPVSKQLQDVPYHSKAADFGDREAMYRCGFILTKSYLTNGGNPNDLEKGLHFLKEAADLEHTQACFLLGRIFYQGILTPKDCDKSIKYLSLAAFQGHTEAKALLRIIENLK